MPTTHKRAVIVAHHGLNSTVILCTHISSDVFKAFDIICKENGLTKSAMLRSLVVEKINEYVREHHKKAPAPGTPPEDEVLR
jgi:ABC-type multidrug transport system ATPase subunit